MQPLPARHRAPRSTIRFQEEYLPALDLTTGRPLPVDDEPDVARLTDHHELDLETPVREAIQLAEPIAPLHSPDCPGLCIVCGLPLEEGEHDHPDEDIDPRMEALRGLPGRRGLTAGSGRTRLVRMASGALAFVRSDRCPIGEATWTDAGRSIAALIPVVTSSWASRPSASRVNRSSTSTSTSSSMSGATSSIRACPCGPMPSPGGHVLFFDHTPLYVYFVALMTAIGGPTDLLLRSTTLVFGLLTVLLVFRIGLELRGVGAALVGSMLVAVNPFFVTYSWFVRMEVPMCFFLVLAIYLLIHERLFLAALAIATAVMLKEIALAFWLVAVAVRPRPPGGPAAAVVALPTAVVFGAWLVYANEIGHVQLDERRSDAGSDRRRAARSGTRASMSASGRG